MAKRMFDTGTFSSPYMRGLQGAYKVLWLYMKLTCDHAGIWDKELDIAAVRCGFNYEENDCIKAFGDAIIPIENGAKWFIPEVVLDQYGEDLNPANKVHLSVINILKKYDLSDKIKKNKPLVRGLEEAIYKDIYKDKDKEIDIEMKGGMGENKQPTIQELHASGKLHAGSHLSMEECKWMLVHSDLSACIRARELLCARYNDLIDEDKRCVKIETLDALATVFNMQHPMTQSRPLDQYTTHFGNWLRMQNRTLEPEKILANASGSNNNGGRQTNSNTPGNRGANSAAIIVQGGGPFG